MSKYPEKDPRWEGERSLYLEQRTKVVEKCQGCENIVDNDFCKSYIYPNMMWRNGECMRFFDPTKNKREIDKKKEKLNPIKASKRGMGM